MSKNRFIIIIAAAALMTVGFAIAVNVRAPSAAPSPVQADIHASLQPSRDVPITLGNDLSDYFLRHPNSTISVEPSVAQALPTDAQEHTEDLQILRTLRQAALAADSADNAVENAQERSEHMEILRMRGNPNPVAVQRTLAQMERKLTQLESDGTGSVSDATGADNITDLSQVHLEQLNVLRMERSTAVPETNGIEGTPDYTQ